VGIEIPGSLRWVADKVLGTDWPDADETAMQRCADHWDQASVAVESLNGLSDATVRRLLDSIAGDVNTAIADLWQKIGGDAGAMHELMETCDALAEMLDGAAQDVRRAKLAIIANLVALAASLVAAAATVWAFGAGAVAGAAASLAARASIQMIIRQLIAQIVQRILTLGVGKVAQNIAISAAVGGGIEGSMEAGLQTYEKVRDLRDDYDYGNIAQAGGHGLVKGAVQGVFKLGARGELPEEVPAFSVAKLEQVAADQVQPDHIIGGILGKGVADMTVGKPEEGLGSRLEDAFDDLGLNIPTGTDDHG
jgi:hypothetical protein